MRTAFAVTGLMIVAVTAFAQQGDEAFSPNFIGINTEADILFEDPAVLDRISMVFMYGPEPVWPVRFRAGLGYFPNRPLAVHVGSEIALIEALNISRAKFLGLYLVADAMFELIPDFQVQFAGSLSILLPVGQAAGISVGGGVTSAGTALLKLALVRGGYPLKSNRQSRQRTNTGRRRDE